MEYPVPTAAERNGIFQACAAGTPCTSANSFPLDVTELPPIFGPNTQNSVNANFFNFNGSGNSLIPLANAPNNEYVLGVPNHSNEQQWVGRLDYQLTPHHLLFARYYSDNTNTPAVQQPTTAPYNIFHLASSQIQQFENAAVGDTWTPTRQYSIRNPRLLSKHCLYPGLTQFFELGQLPGSRRPGLQQSESSRAGHHRNRQLDSTGGLRHRQNPRANFTVSEDVDSFDRQPRVDLRRESAAYL